MNIFRVATRTQAAIFECELKGQISDGRWENSLPHDHWKAPCNALVVVDPDNVGRDFHAKRTYRFAEKWLLDPTSDEYVDVCHDRSMDYARFALAFPDVSIIDLSKICWDITDFKYANPDMIEKIKKLTGCNTEEEIKNKLSEQRYTHKMFHADLTALSKAYRQLSY